MTEGQEAVLHAVRSPVVRGFGTNLIRLLQHCNGPIFVIPFW